MRLPIALVLQVLRIGTLLLAPCGQGQVATVSVGANDATKTYSFEVASIKPNNSSTGIPILRPLPDGIRATYVTVEDLIRSSYSATRNQVLPIAGLPAWCKSQRFDISAKIDAQQLDVFKKLSSQDQSSAQDQMLRALLTDRFKLTVHTAKEPTPAFHLVLAGKMTKAKRDDMIDPELPNGLLRSSAGHIDGKAVSMNRLAWVLSLQLHRPVVDQTELPDRYDFAISWPIEDADSPCPTSNCGNQPKGPFGPDTINPDLFTALQEQVGLKLVPAKEPIDALHVDHVEKPSEN